MAERALGALPSRAPRGGRLVLAYHNVVPDGTAAAGDRSLHLPAGAFAAQLRQLRGQAEVVSLAELLAAPAGRDRLVAVTFDDAYASALNEGLPCCAAEGIPVTVFVAPGLLGTIPAWDRRAAAARWSPAERAAFLTREQGIDRPDARSPHPDDRMRERLACCRIATEAELLAAPGRGVAWGNHTMAHANLGALAAAAARAQVADAAAWLAARLAPTAGAAAIVPVLAYPYGIPPRDAEAALADTGVTHALRVAGGWMPPGIPPGTPPARWQLPRWNVPAGVSMEGFRLRLRGWLAGGGDA